MKLAALFVAAYVWLVVAVCLWLRASRRQLEHDYPLTEPPCPTQPKQSTKP